MQTYLYNDHICHPFTLDVTFLILIIHSMDRIHQLACTLTANSTATEQKKEHLTITDNRSGKTI